MSPPALFPRCGPLLYACIRRTHLWLRFFFTFTKMGISLGTEFTSGRLYPQTVNLHSRTRLCTRIILTSVHSFKVFRPHESGYRLRIVLACSHLSALDDNRLFCLLVESVDLQLIPGSHLVARLFLLCLPWSSVTTREAEGRAWERGLPGDRMKKHTRMITRDYK